MKKKYNLGTGIMFFMSMAISCGCSSVKKQSTASLPGKEEIGREEILTDDPNNSRGFALIRENDCPSCHATERKNIGPSYVAVALKYERTEEIIELMARRIISGSVGTWGKIPMTPHPMLSQEDAEQMVKYILLLKE